MEPCLKDKEGKKEGKENGKMKFYNYYSVYTTYNRLFTYTRSIFMVAIL